jgi:hypothetical protein
MNFMFLVMALLILIDTIVWFWLHGFWGGVFVGATLSVPWWLHRWVNQ